MLFTKEGLGIRSTARVLKISATTLLKRIVSIARNITRPIVSRGKTYEVDELCTYIRHKKIISGWIMLWKRILKVRLVLMWANELIKLSFFICLKLLLIFEIYL
ncbi:hypothetical protein OD917_16350 [Flavobacterium sp. SH_e]|uniref:hypothetical protein n=1 Tax=Flavobacterium sp. SH_e TaxID=2983767 RepID=UPI0021E4AA4B|nr:hypothetical protein [Flavobacterium sp. SH_e]MCV2486506.1 hypothetical protein [Flavobacterium sp. SH_e]